MTPERITQGLYEWLMHASRLENMPMGFRPCSWDELQKADPGLADQWRLGVELFLTTIGATDAGDGDEHLNFVGSVVLEEVPVTNLLPGDEPPPVRPDD